MSSENWYWDTCVFVAFLNDNRAAYGQHVDHIGQFLDDCKMGGCSIYTSTITIAEISKKHLVNSAYGSFNDFLNDYGGAIRQVTADPNVMLLASAIRGLTYTKTGGNREMGTPDAIHLASALVLESNYDVPISGFHTFDNGGSRGLEGRSVPLLSYETWCESCANDPIAKRIITLKRGRPDHPNPKLPLPVPPSPLPSTAPSSGGPANRPEEIDPPDVEGDEEAVDTDVDENGIEATPQPTVLPTPEGSAPPVGRA